MSCRLLRVNVRATTRLDWCSRSPSNQGKYSPREKLWPRSYWLSAGHSHLNYNKQAMTQLSQIALLLFKPTHDPGAVFKFRPFHHQLQPFLFRKIWQKGFWSSLIFQYLLTCTQNVNFALKLERSAVVAEACFFPPSTKVWVACKRSCMWWWSMLPKTKGSNSLLQNSSNEVESFRQWIFSV